MQEAVAIDAAVSTDDAASCRAREARKAPFPAMTPTDREPTIFSGNACPKLAAAIAAHLGLGLGNIFVGKFADGEVQCQLRENVRGQDVFIIQSACRPVNRNLMELLIMIDAAKRASAGRITAVIPYFGYARQDKKVTPRVPITAKLVADMIEVAGADRVVSMDLHAGQIQGFFNIPVDHLFAAPIAVDVIRALGLGKLVIVSPDAGGVERARANAKRLDADLAIIDKRRSDPNKVEAMNVIGRVRGRTAVIYDDIIDTAGTLTEAVDALHAQGAKDVYAFAAHPVLSGKALERIDATGIEKVFVTDSIPLRRTAVKSSKIEVHSVATLFGDAISSIHEESSISSLFI